MRYHHSWSSDSRVAFESIVAVHGGWDAWAALEIVELELTAFDGALLRVKGYQRSFQRPSRVVVHVKSRRVEFRYDAHSNWFEDGAVWLPAKDLRVADGRTLFRGTTFETWRAEHFAYFFGYSFANYCSYPFILPAFELTGSEPAAGVFSIAFPTGFHTHSPRQTFLFDARGLLRRHDYRARLAGPLVYGAHLTRDYTLYRGIQVPRTRDVRARIGSWATPIPGIRATLCFGSDTTEQAEP